MLYLAYHKFGSHNFEFKVSYHLVCFN